MIWWKGMGGLVPLLCVSAGIVAMQLPEGSPRTIIGGLLFGGLGYLFLRLGRRLNEPELVKARAGEDVDYKPAYARLAARLGATHSFMWVPLQYWAYVVWFTTAWSLIDSYLSS